VSWSFPADSIGHTLSRFVLSFEKNMNADRAPCVCVCVGQQWNTCKERSAAGQHNSKPWDHWLTQPTCMVIQMQV
jgi:hypothetical protein